MSHEPIELALFTLSKHFACQLGMGLPPVRYRMESKCFQLQTDGKRMSTVAGLCLMAKIKNKILESYQQMDRHAWSTEDLESLVEHAHKDHGIQ